MRPIPDLMLGGVALRLKSGPPTQEYNPLGGESVQRRTGGAAVKMVHWAKTAISITGAGWMGPGLSGLDFSQPLELRCTQQLSITGPGLSGQITSDVREDDEPWAMAFGPWPGWKLTPVHMVGRSYTVEPVAGATYYSVCWLPVFMVFCSAPRLALDPSNNSHSWTITAEEV
ncbi:hypothetical protein QYE80_08095 [Pseudomonas tohonis]|nr:hypothetical protein L682_27320 [Pseudomonas alcaligenes OT 69]MDN4144935.1 hypothetical protein [Pseudomonas tohonis]